MEEARQRATRASHAGHALKTWGPGIGAGSRELGGARRRLDGANPACGGSTGTGSRELGSWEELEGAGRRSWEEVVCSESCMWREQDSEPGTPQRQASQAGHALKSCEIITGGYDDKC